MTKNKITAIAEYLNNIKMANSESAKKELFINLLQKLFGEDNEISKILDEMALGAEKLVFNIPIGNKKKTGKSDTQYRNVIIEYEKSLKRTGEHAKIQLKEYIAGNWKSGNTYNFTLIATDGIIWKIYSPTYEKLLNKAQVTLEEIELVEKDSIILSLSSLDDFYFFIDHYLFRLENQYPTLENIKKNFGDNSSIFLNTIKYIYDYFIEVEDNSDIKVAYEQWALFLSIAYGSFKPSKEIFIIHTYLSVFSKLLAYEVLTNDPHVDDKKLKQIIDGDIFKKYLIENFVENDFYQWIGHNPHFTKLVHIIRNIAIHINEFDFSDVREDILKGIYQELIDIETRHSLGEYYTPDWLCELIVNKLSFNESSKIIDPACGSGSFLRAALAKMQKEYPQISARELISQITGIDIHPLSVQISKTTILLAISSKLKKLTKPIHLNVYLANTLLVPEFSASFFGDSFNVFINKEECEISKKLFLNIGIYDTTIESCEKLARSSANKQDISIDIIIKSISKEIKGLEISKEIKESIENIYLALKHAIEKNQNGIWKFILQNSYKPFFFKNEFDFVIGNPPWLTYKQINQEQYQKTLYNLAFRYSLIPKAESITHLEIASIFMSHCSTMFLKNHGIIVFVLPRGFINAGHHDNSRNGYAKGFRLFEIWDLNDVLPLFKVPSCVFWATKRKVEQESVPYKSLPGFKLNAKLPNTNVNLQIAKEKLKIEKVKWIYSRLGDRSAFIDTKELIKIPQNKKNYYKDLFKQGATIVPRNLYFFQIEQSDTITDKDAVSYAYTDKLIIEDAKEPWKSIILENLINNKFLFLTAISKNILPFAIVDPKIVHLPINISDDGYPKISHWEKIQEMGYLHSSLVFQQIEAKWEEYKTDKSKVLSYLTRLNYQNGITDQWLNSKYLVLYTASSKDANAAFLRRASYPLEFIAESKTYYFCTNTFGEALYLTAFLNSNFPNKVIKAYQTKGLFGERDIHKRILEIALPSYDSDNILHKNIAHLCAVCMKKTKNHLKGQDLANLSSIQLGKIRLEIRRNVSNELIEIDKLLAKVLREK